MAAEQSGAPRPHVLVLGRAKTGTTFIAKSIEATCPATPVRFVMEPKAEQDFEKAGDASASATIIMKVLYDDWSKQGDMLDRLASGAIAPRFATRIAILRDPRDEVISRFMYRPFSWLLKGQATTKDIDRWAGVLEQREKNETMTFFDIYDEYTSIFSGKHDPAYEIKAVARLCLDYAAYLKRHEYVYEILRYEDAVENNFSAIEKKLGWRVSKTNDLGRFAHTKRSSASKNWMKWFNASDLEKIKALMEPACAALGYDDWTIEGDVDRRIDPEHHSAYARRLVRQYRRQGGPVRTYLQRLKGRFLGVR